MARKTAIATLKKRAEFLAVAVSGKKWVASGMLVQIKKNLPSEQGTKESTDIKAAPLPRLRYGLTASKRVGNAVERNRARRRLRALAREVLIANSSPAYDYVLIARPATVTRAYGDLRRDLVTALKRLNVWQDKES